LKIGLPPVLKAGSSGNFILESIKKLELSEREKTKITRTGLRQVYKKTKVETIKIALIKFFFNNRNTSFLG
jgi:hypothetical protein